MCLEAETQKKNAASPLKMAIALFQTLVYEQKAASGSLRGKNCKKFSTTYSTERKKIFE